MIECHKALKYTRATSSKGLWLRSTPERVFEAPTLERRFRAPSGLGGAVFASVARHEKSRLERRFRALSGLGAGLSNPQWMRSTVED